MQKALGRIPVWLTPEQITFLIDEWRKIPHDADAETLEKWGAVAFRALSALQKAGLVYSPDFAADQGAYRLPRHKDTAVDDPPRPRPRRTADPDHGAEGVQRDA